LYRWTGKAAQAIYPLEAEFATPQWVFGMSTYGFIDAGQILCCYSQNGQWHLAMLNLTDSKLTVISSALTDISAIHASHGRALLLGASPKQNAALYRFDPAGQSFNLLANSSSNSLDESYLSHPKALRFPTSDGESG